MLKKAGVFLALVTISLPLHADFKGHHAPGGWGMQSATQTPQPGQTILSPFYTRYYADKVKDHDGNTLNLTSTHDDITVNALGLFGWWVGDHKLLGANWGAQATMFFQDNSVEIADFHASQDFAMGDIFIQPLNLGWHQPRSDFMVTAGVYLPTGKYHPGGDDNSGLGMWTLELGAGSTLWLFP